MSCVCNGEFVILVLTSSVACVVLIILCTVWRSGVSGVFLTSPDCHIRKVFKVLSSNPKIGKVLGVFRNFHNFVEQLVAFTEKITVGRINL